MVIKKTVLEYLKIVNNVPAGEELTANHLYRLGGGFIDVVPDEKDFEHVSEMAAPQFLVGSDIVLVRRLIAYRENGESVRKKVERETMLNDDIALHCRKGTTPVSVLEKTITALIEIYGSATRVSRIDGNIPSPIEERIATLQAAVEHYKSLEEPTEGQKAPGL